MAHYTYGSRTICPFYLHEARLSITCEGLAEGTQSMTRFSTVTEKKRFQAGNCDGYEYGGRCPLAAALLRKYEDH